MMEKTRAYRKELAESFLKVLEEKELDWKEEWDTSTMAAVNAKSGKRYKGINRFRLMLTAMERKYDDPRWATFNQIQDLGCRLENAKGQGVKVEYWYPYDREEKKKITWAEYEKLSDGIGSRYILLATYSTVFNSSLISGLPRLPEPEKREISPDKLIHTLSENMGVEILNDGGDRAFYRPSEDKIHLPEPGRFYSDYACNSTALHELAHATGAPHRLNRDMIHFFGSPEYAYEELIAEISSCFMSGNLALEQDENHVKNHKAYVHSWIQSIRQKPETLVKAIGEAEKAATYMEMKAALILEKDFEIMENTAFEVAVPESHPKSAIQRVLDREAVFDSGRNQEMGFEL